MASSLIHMCVANEINKVIKKDRTKLLIGSIAPDISKLVNMDRDISHFIKNNEYDIDLFLSKYKNNLSDDFVLGYYIHLYTDYLWEKYFMTEVYKKKIITKLDGTKVKCYGNMISLYIYNDYTNLNNDLIDLYELDLDIFYNEIPEIDDIIKEIPMDKIDVIVDKAGVIIANSKKTKAFVIDINEIKEFITLSVELILSKLNELQEYINF